MRKLVLLCSLLAAVIAGVSCANLKATDILNSVLPNGSYELTHASYGKHKRQGLDIYTPKAFNNKPPIVFVYGGAWRSGDKDDFEFVAHALVGLGHTVIIPDYRLYPEVIFPKFIDDVADAIAFVEDNSEELLGFPLNCFVLMGHSSGAHTSALLTTDGRYFKSRAVAATQVALIAMAGPYDLPLDHNDVTPVFPNSSAQETKPVLQVHNDLPPILLLHGKDDKRVSPKHATRFSAAIQQSGAAVTLHMLDDVDHTEIIASLAAPLRGLNSAYEVIDTFLAGTGQTTASCSNRNISFTHAD